MYFSYFLFVFVAYESFDKNNNSAWYIWEGWSSALFVLWSKLFRTSCLWALGGNSQQNQLEIFELICLELATQLDIHYKP